MSDQLPIKVLKKRGRKPKNKIIEIILQKEEIIDTEKEVIIAYLPINLNDLENDIENTDDTIFIKSESQCANINKNTSESNIKTKIENLNISID